METVPYDIALLAVKIDEYVEVRTRRRKLEAEAEKLKEEKESPLEAEILEALRLSGAGSVGGSHYNATLVRKTSPQVADWKLLYEHIQKTGEFELIQRRLSPPAVKERWDEKIEVP